MFDNIGRKIKTLAKWLAYLGFITSVISGIVLLIISLINFEHIGWQILLVPIQIVLGCLISWLSVIILYGFGELIDKVSEIEKNTRTNTKTHSYSDRRQEQKASNNNAKSKSIKECDKNDTPAENDEADIYIDVICPNCNKELSFFQDTRTAECPWCNTSLEIK